MRDEFIFQQDNDPKHTSGIVEDWISEKGIRTLIWPPNSPDLNPIENCFHLVKKKLKKMVLSDSESLWEKTQEIWNEISKKTCNTLVSSMKDHIKEVYRNKGGSSHY